MNKTCPPFFSSRLAISAFSTVPSPLTLSLINTLDKSFEKRKFVPEVKIMRKTGSGVKIMRTLLLSFFFTEISIPGHLRKLRNQKDTPFITPSPHDYPFPMTFLCMFLLKTNAFFSFSAYLLTKVAKVVIFLVCEKHSHYPYTQKCRSYSH